MVLELPFSGGVGPVGGYFLFLQEQIKGIIILRGEEEGGAGGGVGSGPGVARTILLLHIISARPSKKSLMVITFLKVHRARLLFLVLQEH
jgi:hypothetical protein